jgi:hypothetical protein
VALLGSGCFRAPESTTPTEDVIAPVVGVMGVVKSIDGTRATLRLPDGSQEIVESDSPLAAASIGLLAQVDGTRDLTTRVIHSTHVTMLDDAHLYVTAPVADSTVTSPLIVFGFGRVFEQTFQWRIKDAAGAVVKEGYAMTDAEDIGQYGPFRLEIMLPAVTEPNITLEVYEISAKDGRITNLVSIPLKLLNTDTSTFNVYFSNGAKGSNKDCALVFPVQRTVAKTSAVGRAAILALLEGPTLAERRNGFSTNIPEGTQLTSLAIHEGQATADFTGGIQYTAGSCRVGAIRSAIETTLTQFPTVQDVVISVNGDSATALQP